MALWMARAGRHGEYENRFLEDGRIYLIGEDLPFDLGQIQGKTQLSRVLGKAYPSAGRGRIWNKTGQVWFFSKKMASGDWVVLPSMQRDTIHVGEIRGDYGFEPDAPVPLRHYRDVQWIAEDIPTGSFDPDLLRSFSANLTICPITRNQAESRVRTMAAQGWKPLTVDYSQVIPRGGSLPEPVPEPEPDLDREPQDLPQAARKQITEVLGARFRGRDLEWLVDSVLKAQGYSTFRSPESRDKGADILAGTGAMGFDEPRLCVQVRTGERPLGQSVMGQLTEVMNNVGADQGLLVSWSGFEDNLEQEAEKEFFRVRLWGQDELVDQVLATYPDLEEDIQATLPLKKIWVVALPGE